MPRIGRRPGNRDTRAAILAAARTAFAERGFDASSIRLIAAAAGVDPALVHHYFGTKDQLFLEALQAPFDPASLIPQAVAGDRLGVGVRLVSTVLRMWDSPAGTAAAALLRSAVSNDTIAAMMREFIVSRLLRRLARELDLDPVDAPLRVSLAASQLAGLIMARYIIKIEPLATAPPAVLAASVGPTIQRYLTGTLNAEPIAVTDNSST